MLTSNIEAGAGYQFLLLSTLLREGGLDVELWYKFGRNTDMDHACRLEDPGGSAFKLGRWAREVLRRKLSKKLRAPLSGFRSFGFFGDAKLVERINSSDFDVVHLGWISDLLTIGQIKRIRKPLVWSCFDMWPFAGSNHFLDLSMLKSLIREDAFQFSGIDLWLYKQKTALWRSHHIRVATMPSEFLRTCFLMVHPNSEVKLIQTSNVIDERFFFLRDMKAAKRLLGINDRFCALVVARNLNDWRKGGDFVKRLIPFLTQEVGVRLLVVGKVEISNHPLVTNLGQIDCSERLSEIYAASSITFIPSLIDNIPQVALESLACGTPIQTFQQNGVDEIINDNSLGGVVTTSNDPKVWLSDSLAYLTRIEEVDGSARHKRSKWFNKMLSSDYVKDQYIEAYHASQAR